MFIPRVVVVPLLAMDKPLPKKNLGPLNKPAPKRFNLSADTKVLLRQIALGVGVLSVVALLITGVYHLTRLPALTITTVTATGGETIDAAEVKAIVEEKLAGAYGKLIPRRFFLFYPQGTIIKAVEEVDRIRDVVVLRTALTELSITYGEHSPFALWCAPGPAEACYFVNERGLAFAPAPNLTGGSFIRFRTTETPQEGVSVLPFDDFWNTISMSELLTHQGLFVQTVEVDAVGDVYYTLTTGGELRASLKDQALAVADNLRAILQTEEFSALAGGNFHYIDLRFGNKIYVSEQDVSLAVASTTASTSDAVATASGLTSGNGEEDEQTLATSTD